MAKVDPLSRPLGGAQDGPGGARRAHEGVESNARLTASTAVVLFVLLAAEGVTILKVHSLLAPHVFIGMLLVPPVLLKIGSTTYRFVRYYRGSPAYRRKGPPPVLLRLLGPFVVASTVVVLASGIALVLAPRSVRQPLLLLHKASFVLWFGAMAIHVIGHLADTARLAPRDWLRRTRTDVRGAGLRQWAVVASVVLGIPLGLLFLGRVGPYVHHEAPSVNAEHGTRRPPHTFSPTPTVLHPSTGVPGPPVSSPALGTVPLVPQPTVPTGPAATPGITTPSARHGGKTHPHHHGPKKAKHGA
jgi:hypothetical protein